MDWVGWLIGAYSCNLERCSSLVAVAIVGLTMIFANLEFGCFTAFFCSRILSLMKDNGSRNTMACFRFYYSASEWVNRIDIPLNSGQM